MVRRAMLLRTELSCMVRLLKACLDFWSVESFLMLYASNVNKAQLTVLISFLSRSLLLSARSFKFLSREIWNCAYWMAWSL